MSIRGQNVGCLAVLLLCAGISQAREPMQNKDVDVIVEVKFVDLDTTVVEQLKEQGFLERGTKKVVPSLDNARMIRFMDIVQQDIRSNVLQAPRLTMHNGQKAVIDAVDKQYFVTGLEIVSRNGRVEYIPQMGTIPLGVQMKVRPVVSADRRFVRVHLNASLTNLASSEVPRLPITTPAPNGTEGMVTHYIEQPQVDTVEVDRTMVIRDGNTRILMGPIKQVQANRDREIPILSQIPFIGSLFHIPDHPWETHQILVLVTPRILVPQDTEEKPTSQNTEKPRPTVTPNPLTTDPEDKNDFRTPILPPIRKGETLKPDIVPSDARILRAMIGTINKPGVCQEFRDDVQIVKKCVVNEVDPPRFFPVIGLAQLHHCRWKCTVSYNERIAVSWPIPFVSTQPRKAVIFLDLDHLHRLPGETAGGEERIFIP